MKTGWITRLHPFACVAVLGVGGIALLANGWMGTGALALSVALSGLVYTLLVKWLL